MNRARELLDGILASGQVRGPDGTGLPLHSELPAKARCRRAAAQATRIYQNGSGR